MFRQARNIAASNFLHENKLIDQKGLVRGMDKQLRTLLPIHTSVPEAEFTRSQCESPDVAHGILQTFISKRV